MAIFRVWFTDMAGVRDRVDVHAATKDEAEETAWEGNTEIESIDSIECVDAR
jgi:hypothetical protein